MKILLCSATLILLTVSATAQDNKPTIQPHELVAGAKREQPVAADDRIVAHVR
jgi:hypothetical protein